MNHKLFIQKISLFRIKTQYKQDDKLVQVHGFNQRNAYETRSF